MLSIFGCGASGTETLAGTGWLYGGDSLVRPFHAPVTPGRLPIALLLPEDHLAAAAGNDAFAFVYQIRNDRSMRVERFRQDNKHPS
jgi:hypothetical protein